MSAQHPAAHELRAFQLGKLAAAESDQVSSHLENCPACEQTLAGFDGEVDTLVSNLRGCGRASANADSAMQRALDRIKDFSSAGAEAVPASEVPQLEQLREYRLIKKLGQGGMGTVYQAVHTRLNKTVALKVLPREKTLHSGAIARFEREMLAVGSLDHPHLIRAHDAGEVDGTHFLVMEYVAGRDLNDLANRCGRLRIADACELIRQAALGMEEAHRHGLVHRDIKPSNLMLTEKGHVKVLDLGLALLAEGGPSHELTSTGQVMGTLDYMAPEQGDDSHRVDARADVYGLGATLYKLLTGAAPFSGPKYESLRAKLVALAEETPVSVRERRTDAPAELSALVDRLLAKRPEDRLPTAQAIADALAPFCVGADLVTLLRQTMPDAAAVSAQPTTDTAAVPPHAPTKLVGPAHAAPPPVAPAAQPPVGTRDPSRRRRAVVAAGLGSGLALLALVVFYLQTRNGTLRIEIHDAGTQVAVVGSDVIVTPAEQDPVTLTPGEHALEVRHGTLKFTTEQFVINKGKQTIITVELIEGELRVVDQKGQVIGARKLDSGSVAAADPDRAAAEKVLTLGGSIKIRQNGEEREITTANDLPQQAFELTAINLENCAQCTDADLACFQECRNLESLVIGPTQVTDAGLQYFQNCDHLRRLDLTGPFTDTGLANLRGNKDLQRLYLFCPGVTDAGLANFEGCRDLTDLTLLECSLTDAGLAVFKDCKKLTRLDLQRQSRITDAGLEYFRDCLELAELYLQTPLVTDAGLACFGNCKKLKHLSLGDAANVTDAGLAHFQECAQLEYVGIASLPNVTDVGVGYFKGCPNLTYLGLKQISATDACLQNFRDSKHLTQIALTGIPVTDDGLAVFKERRDLHAIYLGETQVQGAILADWRGSKNLIRVFLDGSPITDANARHLADYSVLTGAGLTDTRVSLQTYEQLKLARPGAQITWSEPNRKIAEAVLALGGTIDIGTPGEPASRAVASADDLPADFFQVRRISLANLPKPLDNPAQQLAWLSEASKLTFGQFDNLESVDLSGITGETYGYLATAHGLKELIVARAGLTDQSLTQFPTLPTLERLTLDGNDIRGPGLAHLQRQPALTLLSLVGTAVTNTWLPQLVELEHLQLIDLRDTKVTAAGIEQLKQLLPQCTIDWDGGSIAPRDANAVVTPDKPFALMRDGQVVRAFRQLPGAIAEMQSGDIIDIHSSGTSTVDLVEGFNLPLHIRGAGGHRPRLVFIGSRKSVRVPFQFENCDLTMLDGDLAMVDAGITFINCRLLTSGIILWGKSAELVASDSILIAQMGVQADCAESIRCRIENCLVRTYAAVFCVHSTPQAQLELRRCTFYNEVGGASGVILGEEKSSAVVVAEGNIFHNRGQANLLTHPNWRTAIDWQGRNNLYSGLLYWAQDDGQPWRPATIEEWSQIWHTPETGSVYISQFEPLFVHTTLMPLAELRKVVEPVVQSARERHQLPQLGCNWDVVGPGEAYVRALDTAGRHPAELRPEVSAGGPFSLIRKDVEVSSYRSLDEAINHAEDGDLVEIRTDQTLPAVGIAHEGLRRLTIRAGAGFSPVLQGLHSSGDDVISLEGLTFDGMAWAGPWEGGHFSQRGGLHKVVNCTVLANGMDQFWKFVPEESEPPAIVNSRVIRLQFAAEPGTALHVDNSVLFALVSGEDDAQTERCDVELRHCTFWGPEPHFSWRNRIGNTLVNIRKYTRSRNTVEDCYFAAPECLLYHNDYQITKPPIPWQGRRNVYSTPFGVYVSGSSEQNDVQNWGKYVELEEGSFDDDPLLFDPRFWKLTPGTAGAAAAPEGRDLGADTSRIATPMPASTP